MRHARVWLGNYALLCDVPETQAEMARGLEGSPFIGDGEGMLFLLPVHRRTPFQMGRVSFPIDLLFFSRLRLALVVHDIQPGCAKTWALDGADAALELRGGWVRGHGVHVGTPLLATL